MNHDYEFIVKLKILSVLTIKVKLLKMEIRIKFWNRYEYSS